MKIRIIKGQYWYADKVGEVFENFNLKNGWYIEENENRSVYRKDAVVVEDVEKSCDDCSVIFNSESCTCHECKYNGGKFNNIVTGSRQVVAGVGQDAPTVTNSQGGKQSAVNYAFDALDSKAMFAMCKVLKEGRDKYGDDQNWRKIPATEHWNHLVIHTFAWLAGDKSDDHLSHIMCRAMFLYAVVNDE